MNLNIIIETLILVAIWEGPCIFQGIFSIKADNTSKEKNYIFKCQYNKNSVEILTSNFNPNDYTFSYILYEDKALEFSDPQIMNDVISIFRYSLYICLQCLLMKSTPVFITDELARDTIYKTALNLMHQSNKESAAAEHIGFAVSTPFNPQDEDSQRAIEALL